MASRKNVKKVLFPKTDEKTTKLVVEVKSKHTQIGDYSTACFEDDNFPEFSDSVPSTETIDLDKATNIGDRHKFSVKADVVQLEPEKGSWPDDFEIRVNPQDGGTVQVGDKSKLFIKREKDGMTADQRSSRARRKYRRKPRKPEKSKSASKSVDRQPLSEEAVNLYNEFAVTVLAVLHPLRDDGKWEQFEDKLNEFRSQYSSDPQWDILLTLEQAQQMCYHSTDTNLQQAAQMVYSTLKEMPKRLGDCDLSIKLLIEGRAFCYLASIYRHQNNNLLGKANECIDKALARLKDTVFLYDQAIVHYEKASIMLDFDKSNTKTISECLDKCTEICQQLQKKWEFVKKGRYAMYKKVIWLLNSNTKGGRKRRISDENLREAKRYLDELESESQVRQDVPISEQLQCLLASSDQAFRSGLFHEADEAIQKAIELATRHGFDEEPALRRLKDIDSMIAKTTLSCNKNSTSVQDDSGLISSSGGDADASS